MDQEAVMSLFPEMVNRRRYLHRHPELSFQERETSALVAQTLTDLGYDVQINVSGHGVIGSLRGGRPGKTVALRADMDALAIQDEKTCDYASTVSGVMHACGHDGHVATLLGVAEYFSQRRTDLAGEIRLLFQPAEEVYPGGALSMIAAGALEGVDVIYGVHLWTPLAFGSAASVAGPLMASTDDFYIEMVGSGGHGGMPHNAVDSIVAASALVVQLQSIVSRSIDPLDPAVVTIGSIQGGTAVNVIAERCKLSGTVRCFKEETRHLIAKRIQELAKGTAQGYGASASVDYVLGYPSLVNDEREVERFFELSGKVFDIQHEVAEKIMPAEDFSYYLKEVPGCFMLVGAGNPVKGTVYPHHHPKFDFEEEAMLHAAGLLITMAESFMQSN